MKASRRGLAFFVALLLLLPGIGWQNAKATQIPYFLNRFESTPLDLTQYWGKAYLLFFFTEASQECAELFPIIKQIYETYSSDALQIILIHEWVKETEVNTQSVIERFGLHGMTFFEDMDQSILKKIYPGGVPVLFFMDAYGYLHDAIGWCIPYEKVAEIIDYMGVPLAPLTTPAPEETPPPSTEQPANTEPPPTVPPPEATEPESSQVTRPPTPEPTPTSTPTQTEQIFLTRLPDSTPVTVTRSPVNTGAAPLTPPP